MKRGLGRIFQRGSVYWIAYYHRGREYRESTGSDDEKVAVKLLKKRLGEMGRGKLIGPTEEKVTFESMAQDLLNDYKTNGKRSLKSARLSVRHLRDVFGFDRALDITTDRVRAYIAQRQETKAANASINRELAALKRMFSLAVQAGRLSSKPHIPMLEEQNARQGFLDHGTFLALRDALPEYLKDPVAFLYYSGWRCGEMRGLEWRDVDLVGRVVRLRPLLSKNKDGRVLPLNGELLDLIERAVAYRRLDCPHVFHVDGEPIGDFRKAWWRASIAAGLGAMVPTGKLTPRGRPQLKYRGLTPHDLRRSAVRNMVRAGIPERVCMALSGHKTRSVFDRYNVVDENDLLAAAERLQTHLGRQPQTTEVSVITPARKAG